MIALVQGTIQSIEEKNLVILTQAIGLSIHVPSTQNYQIGQQITLHTYLHWNSENGPLLAGFASELEKRVFLLIIDCPKIGPSIALNILAQISPHNFLQLIQTQNSKGLSKLHGIGPKKAEQIILELKDKINKITDTLNLHDVGNDNQKFLILQELQDALTSLNYSKLEISQAINHLNKQPEQPATSFDSLLRGALAFLSSTNIS